MKATCTFKCFFQNRIIKPGEILDLTEEDAALDIVKSSFSIERKMPEIIFHNVEEKEDETDSTEEIIHAMETEKPDFPQHGKTPTTKSRNLTVEELRRRLDEIGVVYPEKAAWPVLNALYLQQVNGVAK